MLVTVLEIAFKFIESFLYYYVFDASNIRKKKSNKIAVFILFLIFLFIQLVSSEVIARVSVIIILLISLFTFFEEKLIDLFLHFLELSCLLTVLGGISDTMFHSLNAVFFNHYSEDFKFFFTVIISLCFLAIICHFVLPNKRKLSTLFGWKQYIQLIALYVFNFIILCCFNLLLKDYSGKDRWIAMILMDFLILFELILMLRMIISKQLLNEKNEQNKYMLSVMAEHYEYIKELEQETMEFRHDYKNHIDAIRLLLSLQETDKVTEYINKMWGKTERLVYRYRVNNDIANAIIHKYVSSFEKQGIHFTLMGEFPSENVISDIDMCTILSNLLQNAYEAVVMCTEKEVSLKIAVQGQQLIIEQTNNYENVPQRSENRLLTRKNDKKNHGFGMGNISECVSKYEGYFLYRFNETERKFISVICIPLE